MKFLLAALLCALALSRPACAADPYQAALPLYADNARAPFAVHVTARRAFPDCRLVRFTYVGKGPSDIVPALLYLPNAASVKHRVPCLIVLHGLGGTKEEMAGLCRFLASAGYASLAIDLYHHGERAPAARRRDISADELTQELATAVTQTAIDVRRGLDYLGTRPEIDTRRLGLAGFSLGAIIGAVAAGVDTRLKATVLISGGGGWGELLRSLSVRAGRFRGQRITGIAAADWGALNARLAPQDPLTFAPHIAPRALLMLNGDADDVILPDRAQALYEAARSGRRAHVTIDRLPRAGHLPPVDAMTPLIRAWLAGHL